MTYLLDTNIISALGPTHADRPTALIDWLDRRSDELFLSVVTAAEIRAGIAKAARGGAKRKAENLESWWEAVEHLYGDRILPLDLKAATIAGALTDRAGRKGMRQASPTSRSLPSPRRTRPADAKLPSFRTHLRSGHQPVRDAAKMSEASSRIEARRRSRATAAPVHHWLASLTLAMTALVPSNLL